MRDAAVLVGFLMVAGMALASERGAEQAGSPQIATEVVVLSVEGMT